MYFYKSYSNYLKGISGEDTTTHNPLNLPAAVRYVSVFNPAYTDISSGGRRQYIIFRQSIHRNYWIMCGLVVGFIFV